MIMRIQHFALPLALALLLTPAFAQGKAAADSDAAAPPAGESEASDAAPATADSDAPDVLNLAVPPSAIRVEVEPTEPEGPVLTLEEALKATRIGNPDLKAAKAALVAADTISQRVWSNYLPQVSLGGSYTRNSTAAQLRFPDFEAGFSFDAEGNVVFNEFIDAPIQKENQWGGQLQVSQPLFVAPLIPAIQNAYTAEEIARLSTEQVRRELLFGTAQAWYGAVGLKESIRLIRQQVALLREHLRIAETAFGAGTVPQLSVLRARIELGRAEQDVVRAVNAYAGARGALAVLMGRKDIRFEVPSFQLPADSGEASPEVPAPAEFVDEALRRRPDAQIQNLNLEMKERDQWAAWFSFLPVLAGNWTYRYTNVEGFSGEKGTWAGMITLSIPLIDGGSRLADLAEAKARIDEQLARIESTENRVIQEIRQALIDIATSQANLAKAIEQIRLARANWRAVEKAFEVGAASAIEVADAATSLQAAELSAVGEAVRLRVSEIGLAKAVGAADPTETRIE